MDYRTQALKILPHICGLDFEAYATRGVHLERTQTLAGGAKAGWR